jgi:hypothetical protein
MDQKYLGVAGRQWLTPVILATQEAEIRRIKVRSQQGQTVQETLSEKNQKKTRLVEWLKVKPLSSNPSTAKYIYTYIYIHIYTFSG